MRTSLAIALFFFSMSCETTRKQTKASYVKSLSVCTAIQNGGNCTNPELSNHNFSQRIRDAAFPKKGSTDVYVSANFENGNPKDSFDLVLSLNGTQIASSSPSSVSSNTVTQKLTIPTGLAPGHYTIRVANESGSDVQGQVLWSLTIFPEADIKPENIKLCEEVNPHTHQCEDEISEFPKGSEEMFVTLIHDNLVPTEKVSIHVVTSSASTSETQDSETLFKTDPIAINQKSITQKISIPKPTNGKPVYIELNYSEDGVFKPAPFIIKQIGDAWDDL